MTDLDASDHVGDWPPAGPRSASFLVDVATTLAARGGVLVLGLGTSVLINRSIGPEGRGEVAVATAAAGLLAAIGTLGLHASNTYDVGRDRRLLGVLLGNSFAVASAAGVGAALLLFVGSGLTSTLVPLPTPLMLLVILSVPVGVASTLVQNLLVAVGRVRAYNVIEVGQRIALLAAVAGLLWANALRSTTVYAATAAAGALMLALGTVLLRQQPWSRLAASWSMFRRALPYSSRAFLASVAAYLVVRVDVLLLDHFRGAAETGVYAVAVAVGDLLLTVPTVIGLLLFPVLTRVSDDQERYVIARRVFAATGVGMTALLLVFMVLRRTAVVVLYGDAFASAAPPMLLLLPGILALSLATIANNYLAAVGMPASTIVGPIVGSVVNIGLNLALAPRLGATGAAMSSSAAYGVMMCAAVIAARRARPPIVR